MEANTDGNIAGAIPPNAVSVYGQTTDAMDEFPVLKAFQQYIDAEQAKARKRLISLGIFFAVLTGAVIAVFVSLLIGIERRNQTLNDRLIEYAMRDRQQAAPAVQPAPQQDNAMMMVLTSKLEELQNKLKENQEKMEKVAEERKAATEASASSPSPTKQDLEIERLKLQLTAEKEKVAAEKERRRQAELEEYRRKHYPELYEQPKSLRQVQRRKAAKIEDDELDDDDAINYFDDDDDEDEKEQVKPPARKPAAKPKAKPYTIPVEVRGTKSNWKLPD